MTHDITIPPEAVEAAKRDVAVAIYRFAEPDTRAHELTEAEIAAIATAALRAGIAAWPGGDIERDAPWSKRRTIHLPLPQENNNAES